MLPKENCLKKRKDFERIFKSGKGFKEDLLFLKLLNNNLESSRIGFIVSQKVSKKAVVRNKIKRELREIVRPELKKIKKGIDIALVVLPGLEKKSFQEIKEVVNEIFKKAKIVNN